MRTPAPERQRFHTSSTQPTAFRRPRAAGFAAALVLASALQPRAASAQSPPAAEQPRLVPPGYTLRVYTNLLEIPTLVLNNHNQSHPGLTRSQFTIRLDSGPAFHPAHARLEGDDPIDLAILLDVNDRKQTLVPRFASALSSLVPQFLSPSDRVTVYAADCTLVRFGEDAVPDASLLKKNVEEALHAGALHAQSLEKPACGFRGRLWDSIATVAGQMNKSNRWRAILVVSDGIDSHSLNSWRRVAQYANSRSIAIFGIAHDAYTPLPIPIGSNGSIRYALPSGTLSALCASTGGELLDASPRSLERTLKQFIDLLRNRYILAFPSPSNSTAGSHVLDVTVSDRKAVVRPSGVTAKVPDPSIAADPHTISPGPADAPLLGPRRPLPPQR